MKELYRRTFAISDFSVKKNPFNIVNFRYTIKHRYYCKIKKNQSSHVLHIWFTKGCITVVKGIMFIIAAPEKNEIVSFGFCSSSSLCYLRLFIHDFGFFFKVYRLWAGVFRGLPVLL